MSSFFILISSAEIVFGTILATVVVGEGTGSVSLFFEQAMNTITINSSMAFLIYIVVCRLIGDKNRNYYCILLNPETKTKL